MAHPLMPKATAVWLVENTALTFEQISAFCGLHDLEVQAIADGEVATGMQGLDPIAGGELTQEELDRCAADPDSRMEMAKPNIPLPKARTKGARYTPLSKRQDRPDAIAWLVRNQPEFSDSQISKLIGTTKPTINAIRERSHWNMPNIKPQNPVNLGLCSSDDLEKAMALARARAGKAQESQAQPPDEATGPAAADAPVSVDPVPGGPVVTEPDPAPVNPVAHLAPGETLLVKGVPKPAEEPEPEPEEPPATEVSPENAKLEEAVATPDVLKAAEDIFAKTSDDAAGDAAKDAAKDAVDDVKES